MPHNTALDANAVTNILDQIQLPDWYRELWWEVEHVVACTYPSPYTGQISVLPQPAGPVARFRIVYNEPDVITSNVEKQYARWWYIEPDMESEAVIKTAWAALVMSDEHRRREAFAVEGVHIFNPHRSIFPVLYPSAD